jgi:hypothetical protein
MVSWRRPHDNVAEPDLLAFVDLDDALTTGAAKRRGQTARGDDGNGWVQSSQRGDVQVVVVPVRHEHGVDSAENLEIDGFQTAQVGHPVAEQGIGQEPNAVEVYEDSRMPDPGELSHAGDASPLSRGADRGWPAA